MSKIICDVCGTSYPEAATQCPICGCVRSADAHVVTGDTNDVPQKENTYTYVKGGRFSKANVKKRNSAQNTEPVRSEQREVNSDNKGIAGLIIVIAALLVAIIAVSVYIYFHFFGEGNDLFVKPTTQPTTVATTELEVPCVVVAVDKDQLVFDSKDETSYKITATKLPTNTTDLLVFTSADENIATVSPDGVITAVGNGETFVKIVCGDASAEVRITCAIDTVETTEATTVPQYATDDFKFKKTDITMGDKGQTFTLYSGNIPADVITWTSDNDKVATINAGVVTAVGKGTTNVHAEYSGVKLTCVVRCAASVGTYVESAVPASVHLSSTDVTLRLSDVKTFTLNLLDKDGAKIECSWTVDNTNICKIENNLVEGLAVGTATISTVYENVTYKCIVRVAG